MGEETAGIIVRHLLWSIPPEEVVEQLFDAEEISIDLRGVGGFPKLTLKIGTQDVLAAIFEQPTDEIIQVVTDRYFELVQPLFQDEWIASVSVTRPEGPFTFMTIRPEDYPQG